MQGKLIRDNSDPVAANWPPGAYGFHDGTPYAVTPNGELANLSAHSIHETHSTALGERVWTVKPSIEVLDVPLTPRVSRYHGWLTDGIWRDA